ncbi:hypothetical protein M0811_07510 [Anaeramoeba ignava]|uniref:Uncharacterized protein n=1 Tax=Anaeramoeba ignava TaxID=1746090 RepID=A0A9Q0RCI3_ANAIG|nr:hypothetical protein M0811_07510 [Anaeramoeba ignava]
MINYFILIFLIIFNLVFTENCPSHKTKNDCIHGSDQCNCGWYTCLINSTSSENFSWCLKGDKNGVSSSVNKNDYECPIDSDGFQYYFHCEHHITQVGIALIVVGALIIIISIIHFFIKKCQKKKPFAQKI